MGLFLALFALPILVHVAHSQAESTRLDAQLRMGGDAGASEVIVLHGYGELAEPTETLFSALLLPDAPIVAWWAHTVPPPSPQVTNTISAPLRASSISD